MAQNKEVRFNALEMRVTEPTDDKEPAKIVGYAARFNERSEDLGYFKEQIAPGAFANALKKSDCRALYNHDPNYVLGRQSAGTLILREDEQGLYYEITPPDVHWANDLVESIRRGDIKESSFAFSMEGGIQEWDDTQEPVMRTIRQVGTLYDVSPVTYPAYPSTSSGVRSSEDVFKEHREQTEKKPVDEAGFFIARARLGLAEKEN